MMLRKYIYKKLLFLIIISIILSIMTNLTMVFISKNIEIIMQIIENETNSFYGRFFVVLALCLLYFIFSFAYYYIYYTIDIKAKKISIEYAYDNFLNRDIDYFSKNSVGEITYSITNLSSEIGSYYASFWPTIIINLLTIIILFVTISQYSFVFACGIVFGIIFFIVLTYMVSNKLSIKTDEQEKYSSQMHELFVENISGINIIKGFILEKTQSGKFVNGLSKSKYKCDMQKNFWYSLYILFYDVMTIVLPILTLIFGFLLKEHSIITIGGILAVYSIVGLLQEPIRNIADSITYYKEHKIRLRKIDFMDFQESSYDDFEIKNIKLIIEKIIIDDSILFNNFSLNINENEIISIKGKTGIGKSSILKMITNRYPFKNYNCYYNDINQNDVNIKTINKNIILVEQTPFLFSMTLKENITMGKFFDDDLLNEVINICELNEVKEKYTLDKLINKDTSNISGGEMQRICVARALIRKPKFLLLDEVTASLDEATANKMINKIVEFSKRNNMAIIAISHKNDFESFSDKIIDLNK